MNHSFDRYTKNVPVTKEGRSLAERDLIRTFVSKSYLVDEQPIEGEALRTLSNDLHARYDEALKRCST